MQRPIRPHVRTNQPARCADHPRAQRPYRRLVRQPVGIHDCAVVTPHRAAVDEKISATMPSDVAERDGRKGLAARGHDTGRLSLRRPVPSGGRGQRSSRTGTMVDFLPRNKPIPDRRSRLPGSTYAVASSLAFEPAGDPGGLSYCLDRPQLRNTT
jgi:hypothetical protein